MSRLVAIECELDTALALRRRFEVEDPEASFAGSHHWCRAAARAGTPEDLAPVLFVDENEKPVGVAIFARGTTSWRTGNSGKPCLQWPFQSFVVPWLLKSIWCDMVPPGRSQRARAAYRASRSSTCSSTACEITWSIEPAATIAASVQGAT